MTSASDRRSPWPIGLIGMLAMVSAVERTVSRNEVRFTTVATSAWSQGGAQMPKAARSAVVCFGDSLIKDGVVPPVLERRHKLSAWNLALPKGVAPAHYVLLRRLLQSGARPSAVLIDGETLRDDPLAETRVWPELARASELADLAWTGRDPAFLAEMVLARWLATYRARPDVRHAVLLAFEGRTPAGPWTLSTTWRNWNTNHGAYVLTDRPETPGVDPRLIELARAGHLVGGWSCHPVNDAYVRRFLDLAGRVGVPVFWLLPPTHPTLQRDRERHGWDADYMAYVRRLQSRYPRLTVIDARHAGYPPEAFSDILHLSRTGAIFHTDSVGAAIRDADGPRWVELPRYSSTAAAKLAADSPAVEDLVQSAQALGRRTDEDRRRR